MDNEEKLELKIVALRETYVKRVAELDDEVANLRIALTEHSRALQSLQQEFEDYKGRNPEGTDVQEKEDAGPQK